MARQVRQVPPELSDPLASGQRARQASLEARVLLALVQQELQASPALPDLPARGLPGLRDRLGLLVQLVLVQQELPVRQASLVPRARALLVQLA